MAYYSADAIADELQLYWQVGMFETNTVGTYGKKWCMSVSQEAHNMYRKRPTSWAE